MRIPRSLLALSLTLALGLTLGQPAAGAGADPAKLPSHTDKATHASKADQAKDTLAEVRAIVSGRAASRGGRTTDGRDLTVALRDLNVQQKHLSPADRKIAHRFFLRPGNGTDPYIPGALPITKCSTDICVHYTESGNDAPDGSDGNPDTIPDYIVKVRDTVQQIHDDYIAAGYREEKGDGSTGGGSNDTDIYIGDIGDAGLYGFCTTDDPNRLTQYDVSAYCAFDDDYDASEFGTANTPLDNMRVTAAHEYFHATQYAYDWQEDGWIIESTATWAEDEMFDSVNDNRQYLANSPLRYPYIPIDYYGDGFHYGTWIWWRYLTEKFPAKKGKLPKLVLDVWKRLDGAAGGPDDYSTRGLARVLSRRHTNLKKEIIGFHTANRNPKRYYSEGNAYRSAPALVLPLTKQHKSKSGLWTSSHMASATVRFNPKKLTQRSWKLRLSIDVGPRARGGAAVILVYKKSGEIQRINVRLSRTGHAHKTVPFSSRSIRGVDAVLVNTSTRFNCFTNAESPYSCLGTPKDDGVKYKVNGRAVR